MSEASNSEFDPDQLSEAETDEGFGLPEFREHYADTLTPAVLKDWTAKDFASIYVRFRPHLDRHARRFLVNPSQVEEVVQDAFLYLMTTLPELDSELGVLKFLKWKVRLLSIDVARRSEGRSFLPVDEFELEDLTAEAPTEQIERAEDTAVVTLALAKLTPRHRHALVSALIEERSHSEIASEMGLTENAFRQLLYRARSSFRSAFIGEAEIQGKSISEILGLAMRRASLSASGKGLSVAVVLASILAAGFVAFPTTPDPSSAPISMSWNSERRGGEIEEDVAGGSEAKPLSPGIPEPDSTGFGDSVTSPVSQQDAEFSFAKADSSEAFVSEASVQVASPQAADSEYLSSIHESLENIFGTELVSQLSKQEPVGWTGESIGGITKFEVRTESLEITGILDLSNSSQPRAEYIWVVIGAEQGRFVASPGLVELRLPDSLAEGSNTYVVDLIATNFIIGDIEGFVGGAVSDRSAFSKNGLLLSFLVHSEGHIIGIESKFSNKS